MRLSVVAAIVVALLAVLYCMELKEVDISNCIEIGLASFKKLFDDISYGSMTKAVKHILWETFLFSVIFFVIASIYEYFLGIRIRVVF
ncbi:hypothetical protein B9Z55_026501 [Caenorhabditis nigoni]|uniref:Uncharacterized protein n=1 Tax=Caenorhabditis nigoni TaxID=1611254 RepID=A0A2G5T3Q4_9PELO|nr:hypothetical protein B9Z55_026501 [Caenorhabditis nigoni]